MSAALENVAEAACAAARPHDHEHDHEHFATSVREVSALRTLQTIRPWLARVGVDRILDLSLPGVPACPVYQVVRRSARSDYFNAGKGYTPLESLVSGLMEAIEVGCYERASVARLFERSAAGEDDLHLCAADLRLDPATCDSGGGLVVEGHSHLDGRRVWLPAHAVYRELADGRITGASPNGVASGNSVGEAVVHALCEMLERHGLAAFHAGAPLALEWVAPPGDAPAMPACISQLRALGFEAHFLLISVAAGVPVFICFLAGADDDGAGVAIQGYGAHLDPRIAMARALAEAVQLLALCPLQNHRELAGDTGAHVVVTSKQAALLDPAQIAHGRCLDHQRLMRLRELGQPVPLDYLFDGDGAARCANTRDAVELLLEGLKAEGTPWVAHCVISPPELPVVVVKTFCPGLGCVAGL